MCWMRTVVLTKWWLKSSMSIINGGDGSRHSWRISKTLCERSRARSRNGRRRERSGR